MIKFQVVWYPVVIDPFKKYILKILNCCKLDSVWKRCSGLGRWNLKSPQEAVRGPALVCAVHGVWVLVGENSLPWQCSVIVLLTLLSRMVQGAEIFLSSRQVVYFSTETFDAFDVNSLFCIVLTYGLPLSIYQLFIYKLPCSLP